MKFFDLFSGIGGFHLGLERAGHKCVGACEWNEHARSIYEKHFPKTKVWEDATKIDPAELPDFDILCAGFPCQAFSVAGKRLGFAESRGTVFYEIARIAKQKRPRLLLLENVKGLLSHDEGRTFAQILNTLDELGYDAQWQVLNSKYWVPQNRERVFIVGHLRDGPRPEVFPVRQGSEKPDRALRAAPGKRKRIQDERIASTLDATYHKGGGTRTMISEGGMMLEPKLKKLIDGREAERVYDTDGISSTVKSSGGGQGGKSGLYALSHTKSNMKKRHQIRDSSWTLDTSGTKMAVEVNVKDPAMPVIKPDERHVRQKGRRLKKDGEPAFTITANARPHGIYNGKKIRRLTPLECERLQGFPDNWTAGLTDTQRYRCAGNAVTVDVVEFIGRMLK